MLKTRTDIINYLIDDRGYESYLEIGTQNAFNFVPVNCRDKTGVDPDPYAVATHEMTSDKFFEINKRMFDIIFIDGLHHCDQVLKDVSNSLNCLPPSGALVLHDCYPDSELTQRVPRESTIWTGDVWKAWVSLRCFLKMEMFVLNTDWGVGIIQAGEPYPVSDDMIQAVKDGLDYEKHSAYLPEWINLVEPTHLYDEDSRRDFVRNRPRKQ